MLNVASKEKERARLLMGYYACTDDKADKISKGEALDPVWLNKKHFQYSGLSIMKQRTRRYVLLTACLLVIVLTLYLKYISILIVLPLIYLLHRKDLDRRIFRRAEEFERDYTALLLSLASGVKAGMDPISALNSCGELFDPASSLGMEISNFRKSIEQGKSEDTALKEFGKSIKHPDIKLFRTAFLLSRKEGSSLAPSLRRLTGVTRQRQSFRRKIRSAVAMQKLSAYGIAACTLIIGVIQGVSNPDALMTALKHPLGSRLLLTGAVLISLGLFWMIRMTKSRI